MHKHYKLISGIASIVLCLAMIAFGVYAASTSLVKLNASVSFTPSTAKLTILAGMSGSTESNTPLQGEQPADYLYSYYATNYGDDKLKHVNVDNYNNETATFKAWEYGKVTFDGSYIDTPGKTHPDPIYFFIQITNHVEKDLKITVDFNGSTFGDNVNASCLYALQTNEYMKTNKSTIDNMYAIDTASKPLQGTTDGLVGKSYTSIASDITNTTVIDFSEQTTSLSTLMIVIKLQVVDADESIDGNTVFNFTITATNVPPANNN